MIGFPSQNHKSIDILNFIRLFNIVKVISCNWYVVKVLSVVRGHSESNVTLITICHFNKCKKIIKFIRSVALLTPKWLTFLVVITKYSLIVTWASRMLNRSIDSFCFLTKMQLSLWMNSFSKGQTAVDWWMPNVSPWDS